MHTWNCALQEILPPSYGRPWKFRLAVECQDVVRRALRSMACNRLSSLKPKKFSIAVLSTMFFCFSISETLAAQTQIQRDQQALGILAQTILAAGGSQALSSIQGFTENGTATYYWAGQPSGNVTVKSRGLHQFRIDADLPDGKRSTVVNGAGGSIKEPDGRTILIHPQSAVDVASMTFPYLPLIAAMQDPSVSIIYGGMVNHDGASDYDLRIERVYSRAQDPHGNRAIREARDFYVDPSTYLVVAMSDQIYAGKRAVPHEITYSNYTAESGVSVPLTITESVGGTIGLTLQLTQVTFNSQVSDSDFEW